MLCAQHQREESVGVEGLFSVLFALALSGHARSRYGLQDMTGGTLT